MHLTPTVPSDPPNHVVPETDTITTICIYANPHNQNSPVPGMTPPPQNAPVHDLTSPPTHFAPVPDTPSPTTSTPTVVSDCHEVKWYDYEGVLNLDEVPSRQCNCTNQFGDPVYPNSGVWMSRIDAWLMMYSKKYYFFENTNLELLRRGRIPFKDMAEALQFQGVVRFSTRFEFGKRYELWITLDSKYMPAVEFGETDMGRDRFKEIFSTQRYSKQPPSRASNLIL